MPVKLFVVTKLPGYGYGGEFYGVFSTKKLALKYARKFHRDTGYRMSVKQVVVDVGS
jgi:hypothetical protein